MRFRRIAAALFACMALGASVSTAAQAAEGDGWTIGTTENQTSGGTQLSSPEEVGCTKHAKSSIVLTSTLLGAPVELSAEGVDCLERPEGLFAARIDNTVSKGHSEITFTFTGVKVVKPANCAVGGAAHDLTTSELTGGVIMDTTSGSTVVFDRFSPETSGGAFITIKFEGSLCALAGETVTVKGSACGESVNNNLAGTNKTGTLTKVQTLLFGSSQQTTGGCALTLGKAAAQLASTMDFEIVGLFLRGDPFGVD